MAETLDPIEKEIQELFKRLVKEKKNVSFVYSYVYMDNTEVKGRLNCHGSKEEVETHMQGLQEMVTKEAEKQTKRKEKFYGKQNT